MFAEVAVNMPSIAGVYSYQIPAALEAGVGTGSLVTAPFGRRTVQGVVLALSETSPVAETKPLLELLDPLPVLTGAQIALARQIAESTLGPLADVIGLMLPPGLSQQADTLYSLRPNPASLPGTTAAGDSNSGRPAQALSPTASRILGLLSERGPLRGRQIDRHFRNVDWPPAARLLVKRGLISAQSVLPPPSIRPKFIRTAQLAVEPEQAEAAMVSLAKAGPALARRQAALRFLIREPEALDVAWVYAASGCNLADLQALAERDLIVLRETEIWRDPLAGIQQREALVGDQAEAWPELTSEQAAAWPTIHETFEISAGGATSPILLHGVTGSGKTELYLRATAEAIRRGRGAIILVPEIALTPQTVRRFLRRFPGQVGLVHSRLSQGERYDTWRRARSGQLKVLIGPRSALFSPLPDVGLIVIDECHDASYYQSEPPFYNGVSVAIQYAVLAGAVCLLGSATPSVSQRYQAGRGRFRLAELTERVRSHSGGKGELAPVTVVDMREELKAGERGIFSRLLEGELASVLERGEQAILFMNRRGSATYVFCRECGHVLKCPRCETPLTYHLSPLAAFPPSLSVDAGAPQGQRGESAPPAALLCHHCGYSRGKPRQCPNCGSAQIREYGLGSERVEAEVSKLFPSARILRWDYDTTRRKEAHDIILAHFASHRADVLVGTQMLAKGLDLPLVTLVGIVLADAGLHLPDPFAGERAFQTLTQVAGRAGRSPLGGQVVLQTFEPENPLIQAAASQDYAAFYHRELAQRRALGYPPYGSLVRLEFRHADQASAERTASKLAERLKERILAENRLQTELIGPVPCFLARVGGIYRWQVVLRGPEPVTLLRGLKGLDGWRMETEPASLL